MFDDIDQHEAVLGPDGSLIIPPLLLEETDDGMLVTEIEATGDGEA